jgi:hypothetical protein
MFFPPRPTFVLLKKTKICNGYEVVKWLRRKYCISYALVGEGRDRSDQNHENIMARKVEKREGVDAGRRGSITGLVPR